MSTIAPNDTNLVYSPYNWLVTSTFAKSANPGAYIRASIAGPFTQITATFDLAAMNETDITHVAISIDGGPWQVQRCAPTITINTPDTNTWTSHQVEVVIDGARSAGTRWTTQDTAIVFKGFTSPSNITTRPMRRRPLYGLVVGDSITEGARTRKPYEGNSSCNSSLLAWSYLLTDNLGAEVGVVGWSGQGLVNGGSGGVPNFAGSTPLLWQGQVRDLTTPRAPDFVACNVGTNDSGQTDADVTEGTKNFMDYLISATPSTTPIVVFPGWMQTKMAAIQAGIYACTAPSRITLVDTTGWWDKADASDNLHPYGHINLTELSPRAAVAIKGVLGSGGGGGGGTSNLFRRAPWGEAIPIYSGQGG